ncbi:hypothetical protein LIER_37206 [Lithospermum erythrorhizon]|uniref:RNase H type-1 domain-containing protein n=1 Tax=Lithospermum erythrorhizon TaxID=34254 RepID=A0AAV3PI69_LITER
MLCSSLSRQQTNEAKYEELANGLTLTKALGAEHIHIRMDSQLLVGHGKGDFKIDENRERLVGYLRRVRKLVKLFQSCHTEHVPRESNQEADRLSQHATVGYEILPEATVVEWVEEEVSRTKEVINTVPEIEGRPLEPWNQTFLDFLRTIPLPEDPPVAKKI